MIILIMKNLFIRLEVFGNIFVSMRKYVSFRTV